MYLTTTILQTRDKHEADLEILRKMCFHAARLYNVGLYSVRQHYFNTNHYLGYNYNYKECAANENYYLLMSDSAQQILRMVDRDMKGFFALLALKNSGHYSEAVHLPRYKKENALSVCPVLGRTCRIQKNGKVRIGLSKNFRKKYGYEQRYIEFTIPKNISWVKEFHEIRVVPKYDGTEFQVEFVYTAPEVEQAKGDGFMSIDLGVSNFCACTVFSNGSASQFLIDGRRLKNINYYYNKSVSALKSVYDKSKDVKNQNTKRMLRLMNGRENRLTDYFYKTAHYLVKKCKEFGVTTLVIGYNKEMKQEMNIGKKNNQNLQYIPFYKFRRILESLCIRNGISYKSQEESYTSKASALECDFLPLFGEKEVNYEFSGKRVKRGLYKSEGGSLNADINGSVNILRKYITQTCKQNWEYQDCVRGLVKAPCQRVIPLA